MKILALDTATTACSVALRCDGEIKAQVCEPMLRGQSEALLPMVLQVLDRGGLGVEDCDLIAVTRGPGAFTGLRIGLATARGLALAAGVACCGITTTRAIAEAARRHNPAAGVHLVALDSKRTDLFVQMFSADGEALSEPMAVLPERLAEIVGVPASGSDVAVVGDAAERALAHLPATCTRSQAPDFADARYVAAVAERLQAAGGELPPATPLYLRPPDAALPKNGGRLRP